MKKEKSLKEQKQELDEIEIRLTIVKEEKEVLGKEIINLENSIAKEKGTITTSNLNIKNFTARRLSSRRERSRLVREEETLEEAKKVKKRKFDKSKKIFFEEIKDRKDYTTEKYGPEYLEGLGNLDLANGNGNKKKDEKKEKKKDDEAIK